MLYKCGVQKAALRVVNLAGTGRVECAPAITARCGHKSLLFFLKNKMANSITDVSRLSWVAVDVKPTEHRHPIFNVKFTLVQT